jgi:hypothetical protein
MVSPQVALGLYWLIETTPSAMRALMLTGSFQLTSSPGEADPDAP